jgi:hypothetical protein
MGIEGGCHPSRVPETAVAIVAILLIAGVTVAVGIGFGIVVAPRIRRLLDRLDEDDEEPGDRTD